MFDTVNNLGLQYADQSKPDEAEQLYIRALAGREKALGPDHILTLDSRRCLVTLFCKQNKLDRAKLMYQQLLVGYEVALASDHPSTMMLVHNFGRLYEQQDRRQETERMYQRALTGCKKRLGQELPQSRTVTRDLAELRRRSRNLEMSPPSLDSNKKRQRWRSQIKNITYRIKNRGTG